MLILVCEVCRRVADMTYLYYLNGQVVDRCHLCREHNGRPR